MPRNITVSFSDGSSHVYQGAPDSLTPADVQQRATTDFTGKTVTNIDGGGQPAPVAAADTGPSLSSQIMSGIGSAASAVADAASAVAGTVGSAISGLARSSESNDGTLAPPTLPAAPASAASHASQLIDTLNPLPTDPQSWVPDQDEMSPIAKQRQSLAIADAAPNASTVVPTPAGVNVHDTIPQGTLQSAANQVSGRSGKTLASLTGMAGDAADAIGASDSADHLHMLAGQFRQAASARIDRALQGNEDSNTVSTLANVFSMAPLLAGAPAGIAEMVAQSGADGYGDARAAGDSPAEAVGRGTAMALANYVGMSVRVPGITDGLMKAVQGAPAGEAMSALAHAITTNVGGMEATTALSDLYDKMAPGGLRPNMSVSDMLHDMADTAKSATLLSLAVPGLPLGASHLYGAAHTLVHGHGDTDVASAINGADAPTATTPTNSVAGLAPAQPAFDASTITAAANGDAAAPIVPGLDTLHNSIDEAAAKIGLMPKAAAALRDAVAKMDPQDAAAFTARALHRFEANGLTTKAGAPGAFRDALSQRLKDQQPEPVDAAAPTPAAGSSVADQLTAIRPPEAAPAAATEPAVDDSTEPGAAPPPPADVPPITPTAMAQANDIAGAAHEAATSPFNDTPEPTDAQKQAGNYQMGHVQLHGLDVTIENPQGSTRSGVDPDGNPWSNEMAAHYGYIKGTHASDGDHVDTFIGPNPESKTAYVIDQVDPTTGKFDEPKTILGADTEQQARELYAANYADGWNGIGAVTALPMDAFKAWVRDGVKSKPLGDISQWKPTDERAQPDLASPSDVAPGAGDGGGGPAVSGGGDSRPDPAVGAGRDAGGDAPAPAPSAGASGAVGDGSAPDAALTPRAPAAAPEVASEPAPKLLGKPVTDYETPALQRIAAMSIASPRAREVASAEIARRAPDSPEFKKWFGDSKVVDADGKPLTVYHGTNKSEDGEAFTTFDSYGSNHGLFGQGSYFTEDPSVAGSYVKKGKGDTPTVYPVHLSIKNPIDMDAVGDRANWEKAFPDIDFDAFPPAGDKNSDFYKAIEEDVRDQQVPKWEGAEMIQEGLRNMGHDGITHIGGGRVKDDGVRHRVHIAFDPEQVKSAIGNRGTFDPSNADIRLKQGTGEPSVGVDPTALRSEVSRIQAGWKDAPPVHVVDDVTGLPRHIQDSLRSMGAEGKTRALLMPGKGSDPGDVYLIANRLHDVPMAQFALFHEVLGHYGIRKVLGSDAAYSAEMYKLRQANPELAQEAEAWWQAHGRGAMASRMSRGMSQASAMKSVRALSTEEALADRAGRNQPIRGLQGLMAKIQTWLRSVGLGSVADRLESMTQAETASLLARARTAVEGDGPHAFTDEGHPLLSQRDDSPADLPDAVIGHPLAAATTHPDYAAAKGGDPVAAHRLAEDLVTPEFVDSVRKSVGGKDVIVQGVNSVEASGRNKIPLAVAQVLADRLGAESANDIAQSSAPKRTGMDGLDRLLNSPEFDGPVRTDKPYLLLDDTITQGGTMAALASHIRQNGGKVAGEVALTGKDYSRKISLSPDLLSQVRERYASVESDFRAATGYGFDALTESEARYLAKRGSPDAVRARIVEAGEQARRGDDQEADRGAQDPLLSQHASADEDDAEAGNSGIGAAFKRQVSARLQASFDAAKAMGDDLLLKVTPMALGSDATRTVAKNFANEDRLARYQWDRFDQVLKKNYTDVERRVMWDATDQESVLRQEGKTPGPGEGLNSLTPDQRNTVATLSKYGDTLLKRAKDVGMFQGEGLPSWTPRMAVMIDGDGEVSRPKSSGGEGGGAQGRNIVTSSANLKQRKYLTAAETEGAMKAKLGDGATLVRDIRTMPLAMAKLERAIAGRELVNNIKALGQKAGIDTTSTTEQPGFFTVDHPAFKTWAPAMEHVTVSPADLKALGNFVRDGKVYKGDPANVAGARELKSFTVARDGTVTRSAPSLRADGSPVFESRPLYVNKDFEGPLKAVMADKPGAVYSALMSLKSKSMGLIMYSPLIHNAVEWGRALPIMPGKVATFAIYFEGNRIKNDPVQMRRAILDGMVPIGRRAGMQDITGIAEDPALKPGRSLTAKVIGGAIGLASDKAGIATKKGIDAAGDFWHNTLLWDRVGDLQAGLYGSLKEELVSKGTDEATAGKMAAHWANRFAGALPNEAMSAGSRKIANIAMFSRTFTLGNLGLLKDMVSGLPRDVQSQIRTASGPLVAAAAVSKARRVAIAAFIVDVGLMYVGNSLMQDAIKKLRGEKSWGEIGQGYLDRLARLMKRTGDSPLQTLSNPFAVVGSLSSTSENEPGKEDRIRVGTQADGTAIYMRLPLGKVGEDFKNWTTKPLVTAKAKESQLLRPLQQVWNNDDGIGRRVYDPDAEGIGGVIKNAGRIAMLFAKQAVPADAVGSAIDWGKGTASDVDKLKVAGPLAGLTFSKGAPGGPAVGAMYDSDRKYLGAKMDVMPAVQQAVKNKDIDGAVTLLQSIKMTPPEMISVLRKLEVPESRLSVGAFKNFTEHASDDDVARAMRILDEENQRKASEVAQPQ